MEWLAYAIYGLLMAIFGFLLWLMLKDARMTHSPKDGSGWGRGFNTFISHRRSPKGDDDCIASPTHESVREGNRG